VNIAKHKISKFGIILNAVHSTGFPLDLLKSQCINLDIRYLLPERISLKLIAVIVQALKRNGRFLKRLNDEEDDIGALQNRGAGIRSI
jgi:hypothetical protein